MNEISPPNVRIHPNGYCSQPGKQIKPIHKIETGVDAIEMILRKSVLCRHDVENINTLHRNIKGLEREIECIPERNSNTVLQGVIKKIEKIISTSNLSANDIINLYLLEGFLDKDLKIDEFFRDIRSRFPSQTSHTKALALALPYCHSEDQFEEDIQALFGVTLHDNIDRILREKKEKLRSYAQMVKDIEENKTNLKQLRRASPNDYPAYFEELIEKGYLHLYKHLIEMRKLPDRNQRRTEIEKLTFSQISHIALETREAVIKKVQSSIPSASRKIFFVIGGAGVGKTTALCSLRGDIMKEENFNYHSQSDKTQLIGHALATSCTFLPLVEIVNDIVFVDFAGFEDSHGQLVSLGMELALKALINQYRPQLLVLESITNTEGKYASAARLGAELGRLLETKNCCILGITKYTRDPDYLRIRTIEEEQKREQTESSPEEIDLKAQIKALSDLNMPNLLPKIEEMKKKLSKMQNDKKAKQSEEKLPESPRKVESKKRLKEREEELMRQIGLKQCVRFSDLSEQSRSNILGTFTTLPQSGIVSTNVRRKLKAEDEALLDTLFEKKLKPLMKNTRNYHVEFENFEEFEKSILESSLIDTLFLKSNPEIGQFLHLSEMDPTIVRRYDREIVGDCIKDYMVSVITTLNLPLFHTILTEMAEMGLPKENVAAFKEKINRVCDYVLGLLGALPEDLKKVEAAWASVQLTYKQVEKSVEERFKLPTWAIVALCLPGGLPYAIFQLVQWNAKRTARVEAIKQLIEQSGNELDQMYETLMRLKDIEKTIEKQDRMDEAFNTVSIDLTSKDTLVSSMQARIGKIRILYGSHEWDKRVSFLFENIAGSLPEETNCNLLIAIAYFLIEPNVIPSVGHSSSLFGYGSDCRIVVSKEECSNIFDPQMDRFFSNYFIHHNSLYIKPQDVFRGFTDLMYNITKGKSSKRSIVYKSTKSPLSLTITKDTYQLANISSLLRAQMAAVLLKSLKVFS